MKNCAWVCVMALSVCGPSFADWRDHPELPDWCQRGKVHWIHGFTTMDLARVNMLIELHQNLKQSGSFADEQAAVRAREGTLRYQPYICSKTIFWKRVFETHPQLKDACCVDPEGKRRLMYGNPERYAGCYRDPRWRAFIKERIAETIEASHPDSIFFDNFNCYNCYCDLCREQFPAFTKRLLGEEMTLDGSRDNPRFAFAKLMFDSHAALDFFREMRAYIKETSAKPVVISPNSHVSVNWHAYLASLGVNDLVFYEEGHSFPPFTRQVYGYKMGLAVSHGKVVGQLLGLPATVAEERALERGKDWQFHQPEVQESYTYPEEYQLAIAEGGACGATCIPSTNIREQDIRPTNEPHQVAVRAGMKKYYDFLVQHEELYANAQPGGSTAVLYSIWTHLHDRKAQQLPRLTGDLMRAGIPFEVITEDDIRAELLTSYDSLIVSRVQNLSDEDASAVKAFARGGGRVLLTGDCGIADRLGVERSADRRGDFWASQQRSRPVGQGRVAWLADWPLDLSGSRLRAELDELLDAPPVSVSPSDTLVANVLRPADGERLAVHLLNYNFKYERVQMNEMADDDGSGEARTYLSDTQWRARKMLVVDDPAKIAEPVVRFFGNSPGADFQLVVSVNGKDVKTFPGTAVRSTKWHEAPAAGALKLGENLIELRVTGNPDPNPDYFNLRIDTGARTRRSLWSTDEGTAFSTEDLSPDRGVQTGEYLVRITDKQGFKDTFAPEDFEGKLKAIPAENVEITVPLREGGWRASCISPDHDPITLAPVRRDQRHAVFRVPSVYIYGVVILEPGV